MKPATFSLTRRALLAGVAASSALVPGFAQSTNAPARRVIKLTAEPVARRLGKTELGKPEPEPSPMLHLSMEGSPDSLAVLRVKQDEPASILLTNRLDMPVSLHMRGRRGANAADGVPGLTETALAPGDTREIPVHTRQSGTFLLSSLPQSRAGEQNARGLHGVLIVEEKTAPPVDHDLVLAMGDWRLDERGVIAADFNARRDRARVGRLGNHLMVNGALVPLRKEVLPGARIRLRVINVANARLIPLLVRNLDARVIAIDSTPCQPFDPLKRTVTLGPGSRVDMIFDAPAKPGEDAVIEARIGNGLPLMVISTKGAPVPGKGAISPLPDPGLPPAIRLQTALRTDLVITGGLSREQAVDDEAALSRLLPDAGRIFSLNGGALTGFAGKPLATLKKGRVLVIAATNRTAWQQVLAVHGHSFRLLHPYDDGWEPYFLDTISLSPGTTARIALIAETPGKWAVRSAIPDHFDAGIATWFEVTP